MCNCVPTVLPRANSNPIFLRVCVYAFKQKKKIFYSLTVCFSPNPPKKSIFTLCILILFCLWGEQTEKWELLSQEEKKITAVYFSRYHGNITFKILSLMRTAGEERLITRKTICYSFGKSISDWLHSVSLTHARARIVSYSLSRPLWKITSFLPCHGPSARGRVSVAIASWCGDEGLSLFCCCCNKSRSAAKVLA